MKILPVTSHIYQLLATSPGWKRTFLLWFIICFLKISLLQCSNTLKFEKQNGQLLPPFDKGYIISFMILKNLFFTEVILLSFKLSSRNPKHIKIDRWGLYRACIDQTHQFHILDQTQEVPFPTISNLSIRLSIKDFATFFGRGPSENDRMWENTRRNVPLLKTELMEQFKG